MKISPERLARDATCYLCKDIIGAGERCLAIRGSRESANVCGYCLYKFLEEVKI